MLDYFLQNSIKSGIRKYKRDRMFLNYRDINNILVLFNIEDWITIQPIINDLRKDGKRVIAWTIMTGHSDITSFPDFVKIVDLGKTLSWMKVFKSELLTEFDSLQYDTLLDLSSGDNNYILSLLIRNKSRFCLSFIESEYRLYDFILLKDEEQDLFDAYIYMKNYLGQIIQ